jgi:hypothetical protein
MTVGFGVRGLSALALALGLVSTMLAVPAAMPAEPARTALPGVTAATLYARVHVMGASASAGFGVRAPNARNGAARAEAMSLARIAELARIGDGSVTGDATGLFFANPPAVGAGQVDAVLAAEPRPTIVFADDFLFWFTYGALDAERKPVKAESQRLALLERGLAQLDRIVEAGIPLVVGDVPNMSGAVGRMLSKAQMPQESTLAQANERIRDWAAPKQRVAVMPLARLVEDLREGKPFDAGRRTWSEADDGALIQRDRLHPTFAGSVAMLACTEQAANERFLGIRQPNAPGAPAVFEHDPDRVAATARAQAQPAP